VGCGRGVLPPSGSMEKCIGRPPPPGWRPRRRGLPSKIMKTTPPRRTPPVRTPAVSLEAKVKQAKDRLDAHVREIVTWHFSPNTGTPFWLEKAKELSFNPLTDVKSFEDLKKFPFFEDEWLRGGPVRRW